MEKIIRNAVKCYLIKDNRVLITKYKSGNKKEGYYDIPGGKIESGEKPEDAAIREMKEETGIDVKNLIYKGVMKVEYPDRIFNFKVFRANDYKGEPQEFEENTSAWIEINELLQKNKLLSNIILLNNFFIKSLFDDNCNISINIQVDEDENILGVQLFFKKLLTKKRL